MSVNIYAIIPALCTYWYILYKQLILFFLVQYFIVNIFINFLKVLYVIFIFEYDAVFISVNSFDYPTIKLHKRKIIQG